MRMQATGRGTEISYSTIGTVAEVRQSPTMTVLPYSVVLYTWYDSESTCSRRFRNFSFYPSIASTGLARAYDSLKTEKRFKEKKEKENRPEEERRQLEKEI